MARKKNNQKAETNAEMDDDEIISKSQLKREAHALTELGSKLLTLSAEKLNRFDLPDNLLEALKAAKNIKKHGAFKRQKLYIGKLLRGLDAKPIEAQFEILQSPHKEDVKQFHDVENWRDLIIEDSTNINAFLSKFPMAQRQSLIKMQRDSANTNPQIATRAKRKLFLYIKEFVFSHTEQDVHDDF
ncbi:FIG138315: Putative alpha helix protein [hydrothermal vent metagenome]|uniref:FIG138315: Putative alpha helix protein n=1 Tax=hydrothermal vent metagenome TaxID=652676 RepID=A0A3B1AAP1_9ZZZZ